MDPIYIGVDGGLSGAIALFRPKAQSLVRLRILDIPSKTRKLSVKTKTEVDPIGLNMILGLEVASYETPTILIETGVGDRRQSSARAYSYGFTNGGVFAVLKLFAPTATDFIAPIVWKRAFGLVGKDKTDSRVAARRYFPEHVHLWETESSHNRAEAALIAVYAHEHALGPAADEDPDEHAAPPRAPRAPRKRLPAKDRLIRL